ncbi:heavy metal-associated isoprenylated plant protein 43-like [Cynara cardunculus var. scolymus]|uniref:heavy metal-associated isoprenylated plant protein 43-like n=1 Tax=Cynara cardunculus var. scolymus TaxID=59895 RepID=UPI000D62BCBC|nr:heavy metal-associated isoprenylated plant protein 43-like [Cynara cardunculus var. scolymus]
MTKKIVLKVNFHCHKCKTRVLLALTKLIGIDQVSFDGDKGTVVVVGDVDPVCVATRVRKTGMIAQIESVGPNKKSSTPLPKLVRMINPLPPCGCEVVANGYSQPYDGGNCMIM